jgi:Uma2 family endonuclease
VAIDIFRMTPRQFRKAAEAGVFGEHKVELLGGLPCVMTPNPPHDFAVRRLGDALERIATAPAWVLNEEKTPRVGRWRPLPDLSIARGPDDAYRHQLPAAADIALIVEVADTTYAKDRGPKYRRYAAAGIPAYWIVDLNRRQVEVHADPIGRGKGASYRSCAVVPEGGDAPVVLDGRDVGRVAVRDVLP